MGAAPGHRLAGLPGEDLKVSPWECARPQLGPPALYPAFPWCPMNLQRGLSVPTPFAHWHMPVLPGPVVRTSVVALWSAPQL